MSGVYKRRDSIIKRAKKFKPMSMEKVKAAIDAANKRLNGDEPVRVWWNVPRPPDKGA